MLWFVVGGFALWIGLVVLIFILRSRVIRHLERMRLLVCTKCAYPLNVLLAEGNCPECGTAYTHVGTARHWRALIDVAPATDSESDRDMS